MQSVLGTRPALWNYLSAQFGMPRCCRHGSFVRLPQNSLSRWADARLVDLLESRVAAIRARQAAGYSSVPAFVSGNLPG
jgi:hypothetical protein